MSRNKAISSMLKFFNFLAARLAAIRVKNFNNLTKLAIQASGKETGSCQNCLFSPLGLE